MEKLCPDFQLLSVYYDGELSSPWKEKLESHIAGCPECKQRLETYRRISQETAKPDAATLDEAKERVWQRLELGAGSALYYRRRFPAAILRKRVSIPLPAIALAALLLVVFTFVWTGRTPKTEASSGMTLAAEVEFDIPEIIPDSDMESVLQYLSSRDNGEMLIIRLPESRNFYNISEPAMIKAADYSRNTQQGRKRR